MEKDLTLILLWSYDLIWMPAGTGPAAHIMTKLPLGDRLLGSRANTRIEDETPVDKLMAIAIKSYRVWEDEKEEEEDEMRGEFWLVLLFVSLWALSGENDEANIILYI